MSLTARDVMDDCFQTLRPEMSISEAVKVFERAGRRAGQRVFGIMVKDEVRGPGGDAVHLRHFPAAAPQTGPRRGEMAASEVAGFLEDNCRQAREVRVGDIMTTELITVTPETHLVRIIDIMIEKHVRRLPVVENGKILGIVYISRVFERLLETLAG